MAGSEVPLIRVRLCVVCVRKINYTFHTPRSSGHFLPLLSTKKKQQMDFPVSRQSAATASSEQVAVRVCATDDVRQSIVDHIQNGHPSRFKLDSDGELLVAFADRRQQHPTNYRVHNLRWSVDGAGVIIDKTKDEKSAPHVTPVAHRVEVSVDAERGLPEARIPRNDQRLLPAETSTLLTLAAAVRRLSSAVTADQSRTMTHTDCDYHFVYTS